MNMHLKPKHNSMLHVAIMCIIWQTDINHKNAMVHDVVCAVTILSIMISIFIWWWCALFTINDNCDFCYTTDTMSFCFASKIILAFLSISSNRSIHCLAIRQHLYLIVLFCMCELLISELKTIAKLSITTYECRHVNARS